MELRIVAQSECVSQKKYGYLQLISHGIRCLLKRAGVKINNLFRSGVICNHVITYGFKSLFPDAEEMDTEEVYQVIKQNGVTVLKKKRP